MSDRTETLQSLHACVADLARWILLEAMRDNTSADRKGDMIRATERAAQLTQSL